jgi:GrpB-like predicted nucleotidyltransferase (UPF0157 family)
MGHRSVIIEPYNPDWPARFREEAARITAIFGTELLSIHHIGSTSVAGLSAKPIIDIMPVVRNIANVRLFNEAMIRIGYTPMGEYGIAGRRFFVKGSDTRTHHVHAYEPDNPEVEQHLNFRDYLTMHAGEAMEYAQLKIRLAAEHRDDLDAYTKAKAPFIKNLLARAAAWRVGCGRRRNADPTVPCSGT